MTRNQAAGYYSTASGVSNKANGDVSWVAGYDNTVNDTSTPHTAYGHLVLGGSNTISPNTGSNISCTVGFNNTTQGGYHNCVFGVMNSTTTKEDYLIGGANKNEASYGGNFLCGLNNVIPSTNKRGGIYLYGQNLRITKSTTGPQALVVLGKGPASGSINVPSAKSTLATAILGGSGTNFNIECYPTYTKMDLPFRLPSDDTEVNAIDAPADPANPTTDEQTLATLGSLHNLGIMRQEQHYFTTLPNLAGGTQNITNDLGLTVPAWATEIIVHMKIVDATNFDTPVTRRCNVSIPVQPSDISTTWRGYLNIMHIAIQSSIYTTVYYAGELYIYQNVLGLENATELKLVEGTPPTVGFVRSSSSFFVEGMEFKGIY